MKIIDTRFKDLKIVKQDSYEDKRGLLKITHNEKIIKKKKICVRILYNFKKKCAKRIPLSM